MVTKGHWPRGKPRHPDTATRRARRQLADIRRFLRRTRRAGTPQLGANPTSIRSAAAAIGVSDRTIRRWLAARHHPAPEQFAALVAWWKSRPEA